MLNYTSPFPFPPLWATHTPLTVIDAKEVGNISVLAGCGGEFNLKCQVFPVEYMCFHLQINALAYSL